MDKTRLDVLELQSKTNKEFNEVIDIITPIIATGKKITKREIDKANAVILEKFGVADEWDMANGEHKTQGFYSIWLSKEYFTQITIYARQRYIQENDHTWYIKDDKRVIYTDGHADSITPEIMARYKYESHYMPTRRQIEKSFNDIDKLKARIKTLENEISKKPFHYYYNER